MISGEGISVGFVIFQCLALPVFKATVTKKGRHKVLAVWRQAPFLNWWKHNRKSVVVCKQLRLMEEGKLLWFCPSDPRIWHRHNFFPVILGLHINIALRVCACRYVGCECNVDSVDCYSRFCYFFPSKPHPLSVLLRSVCVNVYATREQTGCNFGIIFVLWYSINTY